MSSRNCRHRKCPVSLPQPAPERVRPRQVSVQLSQILFRVLLIQRTLHLFIRRMGYLADKLNLLAGGLNDLARRIAFLVSSNSSSTSSFVVGHRNRLVNRWFRRALLRRRPETRSSSCQDAPLTLGSNGQASFRWPGVLQLEQMTVPSISCWRASASS